MAAQLGVCSAAGAIGAVVTPGAGKAIVWNAGTDWLGNYTNQMNFRITVDDYAGFVWIPGGNFTMGHTSPVPFSTDRYAPLITVNVSAFYMQKNETTKAQWDEVRTWAINNGYTDLAEGAGKATNHPVHTVGWVDVAKWCNAASEMEGLIPVYYTNTEKTVVYRTGGYNSAMQISNASVKWGANGYRLPTEAEWEKAARGGVSGKQFPWGTNTISHAQANYMVYSQNGTTNFYSYDVEPRPPATGTFYYHPSYTTGGAPYTSPVGSFGANGYGLYDMAGNVSEFCWDWGDYSYYSSSNGMMDPRGPDSRQNSGTTRMTRGGSYSSFTLSSRVADRNFPQSWNGGGDIGFRLARSLAP